jgi:hypothetical protein
MNPIQETALDKLCQFADTLQCQVQIDVGAKRKAPIVYLVKDGVILRGCDHTESFEGAAAALLRGMKRDLDT